jgi:acyl carrier protein
MARDIARDVRRILRQQLNVDEAHILTSSSLIDDLGADSLSLIELTLALEEEFDVEISGRDSDRVVTVQDVVDLIEARTRKEPVDARATAP